MQPYLQDHCCHSIITMIDKKFNNHIKWEKFEDSILKKPNQVTGNNIGAWHLVGHMELHPPEHHHL